MNHNAQNKLKDNLDKGRLEFWKKPLSIYLIQQKKLGQKWRIFSEGRDILLNKFEPDIDHIQAFFGQKWQK